MIGLHENYISIDFGFRYPLIDAESLDEIEALSWRKLMSPSTLDDYRHTYKILVAKLSDGRLASIAIDSSPSIETELKQAIGLSE